VKEHITRKRASDRMRRVDIANKFRESKIFNETSINNNDNILFKSQRYALRGLWLILLEAFEIIQQGRLAKRTRGE